MQPRLVPPLIAALLVLFALVPATAQDAAPPTSCTIGLFGGSCQLTCVAGKSSSVTASGVSISASVDCPEGSSAACSSVGPSCGGGGRIDASGVGVCKASGVFVYRGACRGDS